MGENYLEQGRKYMFTPDRWMQQELYCMVTISQQYFLAESNGDIVKTCMNTAVLLRCKPKQSSLYFMVRELCDKSTSKYLKKILLFWRDNVQARYVCGTCCFVNVWLLLRYTVGGETFGQFHDFSNVLYIKHLHIRPMVPINLQQKNYVSLDGFGGNFENWLP